MRRLTKKSKNLNRQLRHAKVRAKISGTASKPRLSIFRSLNYVKLQLVDDEYGKTLCAVDSKKIKEKKAGDLVGKTANAFLAGKELAELAKNKKIVEIVFDRGGYKYHGRVKAVADGAREAGLKF